MVGDRDRDIIGVVVVVGTVVREVRVVIVDVDRDRDVDMERDGSEGHRTLIRWRSVRSAM